PAPALVAADDARARAARRRRPPRRPAPGAPRRGRRRRRAARGRSRPGARQLRRPLRAGRGRPGHAGRFPPGVRDLGRDEGPHARAQAPAVARAGAALTRPPAARIQFAVPYTPKQLARNEAVLTQGEEIRVDLVTWEQKRAPGVVRLLRMDEVQR